MASAQCSKCRGPLGDRAGKYRYCLQCHAAYMRAWRPEYSDLTPEQKRKSVTRSYARVYRRRGKLIEEPCVECGGSENIEAHHEDYDRPLDVVWLCRPCHVAHHAVPA